MPIRARKPGRAFSLIEMTIVIVVVALAAPPVTTLLYHTVNARAQANMQAMATALARGLLEEILSKDFEDPDGPAGSFGTEESGRADYDDVDDYDGLNSRPPRDSRGNVLSDYAGFRARAAVDNVNAAAPDGAAQPDGTTDFKRVTVTVAWGGRLVRLKGLRSAFGNDQSEAKSGLTFIERRNSGDDDCKFRVRNDTGEALYFTHLIATWSSPTAYYEEVKIKVLGVKDYHDVWKDHEYNHIRIGSGDTAMFNQGERVLVPAGSTMEIEMKDFHRNRKHGGHRDVDETTFTIEMWAAPDRYDPFIVPPEP